MDIDSYCSSLREQRLLNITDFDESSFLPHFDRLSSVLLGSRKVLPRYKPFVLVDSIPTAMFENEHHKSFAVINMDLKNINEYCDYETIFKDGTPHFIHLLSQYSKSNDYFDEFRSMLTSYKQSPILKTPPQKQNDDVIDKVFQILQCLFPSISRQQFISTFKSVLYEFYSPEAGVPHGSLNDPNFLNLHSVLNNGSNDISHVRDSFSKVLQDKNLVDKMCKVGAYNLKFDFNVYFVKYLREINIYDNIIQFDISKIKSNLNSTSFLFTLNNVFLKGKNPDKKLLIIHGMRLLMLNIEKYASLLFDFEKISADVDVSTINSNEDLKIILGWYEYTSKRNFLK